MRRSVHWNNDQRWIHSGKGASERSARKEQRFRLLETLPMQTRRPDQETKDGYHWNLQRRCSVETSKWSSEDRTNRSGEAHQQTKGVSSNHHELTSDVPSKAAVTSDKGNNCIAEYLINVFFYRSDHSLCKFICYVRRGNRNRFDKFESFLAVPWRWEDRGIPQNERYFAHLPCRSPEDR